jgi:hypothetical protein
VSVRRWFSSAFAGAAPGEGAVHGSDELQHQVIELRLMRPHDMFLMPQTDLFSEYRNFLTGVDFCISELRGRRFSRPVRLEIRLPPEEIHDQVGERLSRTLRRYCNHRIRYNLQERRAQRVGGLSAFRVGIPICATGLALTAAATTIHPAGGAVHLIADHLGWVLAWIGLWFPLDQLIFFPLAYGRESRVLRLLADAEVIIVPYRPDSTAQVVLQQARSEAEAR